MLLKVSIEINGDGHREREREREREIGFTAHMFNDEVYQ